MLFEDGEGKILLSEEIDRLSAWEIDERKLHVYDNRDFRKDLII